MFGTDYLVIGTKLPFQFTVCKFLVLIVW